MAIPALPGTLPVPEGHVRRFHGTGRSRVEAIQREGLKYSSAKGVEGPKAVYSWPDYKSAESYAGLDRDADTAVVEFHTPAASFKDHPYAQLNDVPPEHILGVHEGWHSSYRYAKENNLTSKELRDVGMPRYNRVADELDSEKIKETVNSIVDILLSEGHFVARPKGWEAGSDAVSLITRPGHGYRGMTSDEFSATVGAGKGIKSNQSFSVSGEGTSFSRDFADAESYANFGHTDPRKTGKSNFAVEITLGDDLIASPDGYLKAQSEIPIERITRKWRFDPVDGEIHAYDI